MDTHHHWLLVLAAVLAVTNFLGAAFTIKRVYSNRTREHKVIDNVDSTFQVGYSHTMLRLLGLVVSSFTHFFSNAADFTKATTTIVRSNDDAKRD